MTGDRYALILCHDIKKTNSGYELSEQTKERTDAGINLLKMGKVEKIIMSGGCEHLYPVSISSLMKRYAINCGVMSDKIIEENLSRDTVGQLIFSKHGIMKPLNIERVIIVTSDYHVPRVREEAEIIFGTRYSLSFIGVPCDDEEKRSAQQENASLEGFRKTFEGISPGDDKHILERLLSSHKLYSYEANEFKLRLNALRDRHSI